VEDLMRKKITAVVAGVLLLTGLAATPAQAGDSKGPRTAEALPLPADASGNKFWTGSLCVQSPLNPTNYPVAAAAQQFNLQTGSPLAINFRADCAAAGYTPSRSFTITTYSNANGPCISFLNGERALYNGMWRWTNHPVAAINTYPSNNCVASLDRKRHVVSMAIGWLLGLQIQNSAGWNSRVMNQTQYSYDNVPWATPIEGDRLWSIYTGAYGG
jgi:hypothetical protein